MVRVDVRSNVPSLGQQVAGAGWCPASITSDAEPFCQLSSNIPQGCHRKLPTLVVGSRRPRRPLTPRARPPQAARRYVNASAGFTRPALSFSFKRYDWPRMLTVMA